MRKETLYTYLGTNGTITSPVHLENIYSVHSYRLHADPGHKLTKDGKVFVDIVTVTDETIADWYEVVDPGQE